MSDDALYVTDAELIRRLGVPKKVGYRAIRDLEKRVPGRPPFPKKDPLFGRRLWPAVEKYLMLRSGLTTQPLLPASTPQETQHAPAETDSTAGNRDSRTGMETAKETLERVLGSAARPRRARLSHKKPSLVATFKSTDGSADA